MELDQFIFPGQLSTIGTQWPVCWLGYGGIDVGNSERVSTFSLLQNMQTNSGTQPVSYSKPSLQCWGWELVQSRYGEGLRAVTSPLL